MLKVLQIERNLLSNLLLRAFCLCTYSWYMLKDIKKKYQTWSLLTLQELVS